MRTPEEKRRANNLVSRKRNKTPERQAYMKAWRAANPRDRRAYKAQYDATHQVQSRAYRAKNAAKLKADKALWYLKNRDEILARTKANSVANKRHILAYQANYYSKNKEKVKANVRAYREAYPEKKIHAENRRRVRKLNNGGSHTLCERQELFALLGNVCFYCGAPETHIDHNIPLSRGGTDDISNILPSCRSCNSSKSGKTAMEFLLHRASQKHAKFVGQLSVNASL